jgi:hypothetical protein
MFFIADIPAALAGFDRPPSQAGMSGEYFPVIFF